MTNSQNPLDVPGAKPTLPISIGKKPFDHDFTTQARKYWSNMHMQMGGDHAVCYTTHLSEFMPTAIANPTGAVSVLERALRKEIGETTFLRGNDQSSIPLDEYANNGKQRVYAVMILEKGRVIYEAYPGMNPQMMHIWASVSKTTVGLLATLLEAEGVLDTSLQVPQYVKEFEGTAWSQVVGVIWVWHHYWMFCFHPKSALHLGG